MRLAAPIALSLLVAQLNFVTNTAFLSRYSQEAVAVNAVAGIFFLVLQMVGYGLSNGLQVQMTRRAGEGDTPAMIRIFTNGLVLSLCLSAVMMALTAAFSPVLLAGSLHQESHVHLSRQFLEIRIWGLPFLLMAQLFNSFYIVTGRGRFLTYGTIVATGLNILLDYLLIFGKAGLPEMGLRGAAAASAIAEAGSCLFLIALFFLHRLHQQYDLRKHFRFNLRLSRQMLRVASPLVVQFVFSIGGWLVFFIFIEHVGERELAASQVLRSVLQLLGIAGWAFATACNVLVSNVIGQGRSGEVPATIRRIAVLSGTVTAFFSLLIFIFSHAFLHLFTNDAGLIAFATPSLYLLLASCVVMSVSTVVFNGVVGTGNTLVNLVIEIFCVSSYIVFVYIVVERQRSGLLASWSSEFVYWSTSLLVSWLYLRSGRWKGKAV